MPAAGLSRGRDDRCGNVYFGCTLEHAGVNAGQLRYLRHGQLVVSEDTFRMLSGL